LECYLKFFPPELEENYKIWSSEDFIEYSILRMNTNKYDLNILSEWINEFIEMATPNVEYRVTTKITTKYEKDKKIVNNFSMEETIGQGSFGKVKSAFHLTTKRKFAIKLFSKKQLKKIKNKNGKTGLDGIKDEIEILKTLNHPNILRLYKTMNDDSVDELYFITNLAEKGSIFNKKFKTEDEIKNIFVQTLIGLEYRKHFIKKSSFKKHSSQRPETRKHSFGQR
jgi:serine/threonine protein kinase